MMAEGPDGFVGGLSAHNYRTITDAASATATRDLAELVELGALERAGERRYARYHLAIATNARGVTGRSEEHTSELQSLMRISYAVFCLKKKTNKVSTQIVIIMNVDKLPARNKKLTSYHENP